jgi:hypothetical protein
MSRADTFNVAANSDSGERGTAPVLPRPRRPPLRRLLAGGAAGNEQLTAAVSVVLLLLLTALGITILRIGPLRDAHMFLGMALIGPIVLKMASTGYRFGRYYTANPTYRAKGPPPTALRVIAPIVVVSTIVVFASGVALLVAGPGSRGTLTPLHKVSFIVWLVFTAPHVLGHVVELPDAWRAHRVAGAPWDDHGSGRGARALSLVGALVGGLVLALLVRSDFGAWSHVLRHVHGG